MVADEARHIVLQEIPKKDNGPYEVCVSQKTSIGIDLNVELQIVDGADGDVKASMCSQDRMGTGRDMVEENGVMDDDPFELVPIIETVMKRKKKREEKTTISRCEVCKSREML